MIRFGYWEWKAPINITNAGRTYSRVGYNKVKVFIDEKGDFYSCFFVCGSLLIPAYVQNR